MFYMRSCTRVHYPHTLAKGGFIWFNSKAVLNSMSLCVWRVAAKGTVSASIEKCPGDLIEAL